MDERLIRTCDLFVENWNICKEAFKKSNDKAVLAASTIFTEAGITPTVEHLKACAQYINSNSDKSEGFRAGMRSPLACKMVMAAEKGGTPVAYFNKVRHINKMLRVFKWLGDDFRVYCSMMIADCAEGDENNDEDIRYYLNEAGDIFTRLKDKYGKKLTDRDYPFATMLASSDYETEPLLDDVFECFDRSKNTFRNEPACRAMSYVLAAGDEDTMDKRRRVISILSSLEAKKFKYSPGFELVFMAAVGSLQMDSEKLADAYLDTEKYLRLEKHCRGFVMKPPVRNMYTALMLWYTYKNDFEETEDCAFNDVISLMIQIEVAILGAASSSLFTFGG